jgi:peptide deformylase
LETMRLEVLEDGDPILRKESIPTLINDDVRILVDNMKETMVFENGIGLAAPQVGVNLRVIVIKLIGGEIQELINPTIIWSSDRRVSMEEGCLSIKGHYVDIIRPYTIGVKFMNIHGKYRKWKLKGLESRVVQHEIDHLDGVLMTDYE